MALINCKIVNSDGLEGSVSVTALDSQADIATQFLYVVPDEGYVVSASDFSHGTIDDTEIESITFSDQTTAGAIGNVVKISIDMEDTYSISDNTVINIDFIGMAIDATLIDVIPHIVHNAELQFSGMITSVVITKVNDNPPTLTNTDLKEYDPTTDTNNNYTSYIDYLPCTIKPDEWTKIGELRVNSSSSSSPLGHFHLKDVPYLENLTPDGTGKPLYELIPTGTATDTDSGAIRQRSFDIMFKDSNSHNLIGGEWPNNYNTVASKSDAIGVRLVVGRPALMYDIVSDNVIEVVNIGDFTATIDDIEANEFIDTNVPDKVIETDANPLDPIPLNPGNIYMPNATGIINKVTESEPNPITIQGTPGAEFQLGFEKVVASGTNQNLIDGQATDAVGGKWATYDETHQTTTPTTFKIPASGTWVGALTNIPQITATNPGEEYELKVTAVNDTTISTAASRPQSVGGISAAKNNNAVYSLKQPCSSVNMKVLLKATGDMNSYSVPKAGEYGVDGSEHCILDVTGFGTSTYSANSKYTSYVASFTATREGVANGVDDNRKAILTGNIDVVKFGNADLTLEFDWNDFVQTNRGGGWSSKDTPSDFTTAGLSSTSAEIGATTWVSGAGTTDAELAISNVVLTIVNP